MNIRWFRLEDFYEQDGDVYIFYPSRHARGYPFSSEDWARIDGVLGPFVRQRLKTECIGLACFVASILVGASAMFLISSSAEELRSVLSMPAGIWFFMAVVIAATVFLPILVRLRLKIRRELNGLDLHDSEPPRPNFFIVQGEFSPTRVAFVLFGLGTILVVVGMWAG